MKKEKNGQEHKKPWLCKLGFHKFKSVIEISGYVDCGEVILRNEVTQVVCVRAGCNKTEGHKNSQWIEFKKKDK